MRVDCNKGICGYEGKLRVGCSMGEEVVGGGISWEEVSLLEVSSSWEGWSSGNTLALEEKCGVELLSLYVREWWDMRGGFATEDVKEKYFYENGITWNENLPVERS